MAYREVAAKRALYRFALKKGHKNPKIENGIESDSLWVNGEYEYNFMPAGNLLLNWREDADISLEEDYYIIDGWLFWPAREKLGG